MIVQVTINNFQIWDGPAKFSFAMALLLFLRDVTLISIFFVKKFIDQTQEPLIRPQGAGRYMSRVEMEASTNISNYLLDQKDENIDEDGNTSLHQVTKMEGLQEMDMAAFASPHMLFLINKEGCTPLCIAINE